MTAKEREREREEREREEMYNVHAHIHIMYLQGMVVSSDFDDRVLSSAMND